MKLLIALLGLTAVNAIVLQQKILADHLKTRAITTEEETLSGLDLVNYINQKQSLWKANLSPKFAHFPESVKQRLMGAKMIEVPEEDMKNARTNEHINDDAIPDSFDARTQWPACADSIGLIRDQSACGSCWAFGAAEAMSDRICIASSGKTKVSISADDILACCGAACGNGCDGGYPLSAWKHWTKEGYVTGGNYTSKAGCKPYPYPPCEHHNDHTTYNACPADLYPTDSCKRTCQDGYPTSYQQDIHYGATAYAVAHNVQALQKELMTNGPIEVSFTVYEDFEHYTSGVYVHTAGKNLGGHAVKLIGWGTDNGTPYWLIANSWNSDWGENGFFRIIRGVNECGIESGGVAGEPKL